MAIPSKVRVQLIDLETSGNSYISYFQTEGSLFGNIEANFEIAHRNQTNKYSVPVLVRGLGDPTLTYSNRLANPSVFYTYNDDVTGFNDSWKSGQYALVISGAGLQPSGNLEAADLLNVYGGTHQIKLWSGMEGYNTTTKARLDIIRLTAPAFQEVQTTITGNSNANAWISYDVTSGMNNRRVFSYSIDFVQQISGYSGNSEVVSVTSGLASRLLYYSGKRYNSYCNNVGIIIDGTGKTCEAAFQDNDEPIEICISGGLTQEKLNDRIQQTLRLLASGRSTLGAINVDLIDSSEVVINPYSLEYSRFEGLFEYNDPISGDRFCMDSYSFDYTGTYSGQYSGAPPYPQITKCWTFGTDYANITGLANRINQDLYNTGYYLWHRDICIDSSLSGYFEYGPLLQATVSGNFISLVSQRLGSAGGYQFSLSSVARPRGIKESQNIMRYLMPQRITLQGANTYGTWVNINSSTGLDWSKAKQIIKHIQLISGFSGNSTGLNSGITPDQFSISGAPERELIYTAGISGKNLCGNPFSQQVDFYQLPSGFSCDQQENDENAPNPGEALSGFLGTGIDNRYDITLLRTGFKFSNLNNFNYYRLLLENFNSFTSAQSLSLANGFIVSHINLFGFESGITPVLTGGMCIYGSTYTGQIRGLTSGIITGTVTGMPDGNGKLCFINERLTGTPNGNGQVLFQYSTGQATSPFTGLLTRCITGTGYFIENVEGYYYNTGGCIEFVKPVSGTITGSGFMTGGPYRIINDSTIQLLTEKQLVVDSGYAMLTGIITGFRFNFDNLEAWALLSGSKTGTVTLAQSGQLDFYETISQIPTIAYSNFISGYRSANAVLDYNIASPGDTIFMNGFPIIASSDPDERPPQYFNSITELNNIINSGSGNWFMTGVNDGNNIYLTSLLPGNAGNSIELFTTGQLLRAQFLTDHPTGGATYHYILNPITLFTGLLDTGIYATGFLTGIASGNISGRIKQLDFIRYWTGIWNLQTGLQDFRATGWVTGGNKYTNNPFSLASYSGHPSSVPVIVTHKNNPLVFSTDMVKLTVTGIGLSTGLVMILTGLS